MRAMNKIKAAAFLGAPGAPVSERTIERLAAQGRVGKSFKMLRTGSDKRKRRVADYDAKDLARVKKENAQAQAQPQIVREAGTLMVRNQANAVQQLQLQAFGMLSQSINEPLLEIAAALKAAAPPERLLTFEQAQSEYNISGAQINKAVRAGHLRALPLGRHGLRLIKSTELEAYIKTL
jgi:hypothetical protein